MMSSRTPNTCTSDFWNWFQTASREIADLVVSPNADAVGTLLQPRIDALGCDLGWEVGPDDDSGLFLAFTLRGDANRIQVAQAVVDAAPPITGWTFRVGRPPRQWDGRFTLINQQGDEVDLDASSWSYVLTGYDGNSFFDIKLLASALPRMDESAKKQAALLVTEMQLGEQVALELIGDADLVSPIPADLADRATPIQRLGDHIQHLAGAN